MLWISHALTLDKVIRYNFLPAIRYSFVPDMKKKQLCNCTAPKLHRYSANAREKEHFCIFCTCHLSAPTHRECFGKVGAIRYLDVLPNTPATVYPTPEWVLLDIWMSFLTLLQQFTPPPSGCYKISGCPS